MFLISGVTINSLSIYFLPYLEGLIAVFYRISTCPILDFLTSHPISSPCIFNKLSEVTSKEKCDVT